MHKARWRVVAYGGCNYFYYCATWMILTVICDVSPHVGDILLPAQIGTSRKLHCFCHSDEGDWTKSSLEPNLQWITKCDLWTKVKHKTTCTICPSLKISKLYFLGQCCNSSVYIDSIVQWEFKIEQPNSHIVLIFFFFTLYGYRLTLSVTETYRTLLTLVTLCLIIHRCKR